MIAYKNNPYDINIEVETQRSKENYAAKFLGVILGILGQLPLVGGPRA